MTDGVDTSASFEGFDPGDLLEGDLPPLETQRIWGRRAFDRLDLGTLPDGGAIAIIGRPMELEGIGTGLAEALDERGYRVLIGCHWLKGIANARGFAPMAYDVVQEYSDADIGSVDLTIIVQTTLLNPAIARTSVLWSLDNLQAARFALAGVAADEVALNALRETVGLVTDVPLSDSIEYLFHDSERNPNSQIQPFSFAPTDPLSNRDDARFMPEIVSARREQRRRLRQELSPGGPRPAGQQ